MERAKRIKNLNVRGFCAQGIVSADAIIRQARRPQKSATLLQVLPHRARQAVIALGIKLKELVIIPELAAASR
jgi:hypothetical protein